MIALLSLILWSSAQLSSGSIEGTTIRIGTTQPLANVQVELRPTTAIFKTDSGGRFSFQGVPPGRYTLAVEHEGSRLQVPLLLNPGQKLDQIVLRVSSAPSISGTVYDPFGEKLAAARVQLYQLFYSSYGQRLRAVKSTITDDFGQYRLFWVRPGEYYIAGNYTERDQRSAAAGLILSPNLSKPDDGYTTIYFGGSFLPAQAQKVNLSPGIDSTHVDVYFTEGPRFTVIVELGQACARLALVPEGGVLSDDADFAAEGCGAVQIRGVSPGVYALLAVAPGFASDIVRVNVGNRDVTTTVGLSRTVNVAGQISIDGRRTAFPGSRVTLIRSSREIEQRIQGVMNQGGAFVVQNVGPGEYDVMIEQHPEGTYVRSIRLGSRDVTAGRMRIDSSNTAPLDIALSASGGIAEGTVVDRTAKPMAGAQVVLVPFTSGSAMFLGSREDRYKVAVTDAVGNFRVSGIAPGGYTAFAFEQIEPGAYFAFAYNAQLFNGFRGKGQSVRIAEADSQTLKLIGIPADETAGGFR